jgi:lysozyme
VKRALAIVGGLLLGAAGFAFAYRKRKELGVDALDLIKKFEGLRLQAYQDVAGIWTIGFGSTGPNVASGLSWTLQQAEDDLVQRVNALDQQLAQLVNVPLSGNQRSALLSLMYNIGAKAFAGSSVLRDLNAGNVQAAADDFLKWNMAGGKVQPDLQKRRTQERELFLAA